MLRSVQLCATLVVFLFAEITLAQTKCFSRRPVHGVAPYPSSIVDDKDRTMVYKAAGNSLEKCRVACCKYHGSRGVCTMAWMFQDECNLVFCDLAECGYRLVKEKHRHLTSVSVMDRAKATNCGVKDGVEFGCSQNEICAPTRSGYKVCACSAGYVRTLAGHCVELGTGIHHRKECVPALGSSMCGLNEECKTPEGSETAYCTCASGYIRSANACVKAPASTPAQHTAVTTEPPIVTQPPEETETTAPPAEEVPIPSTAESSRDDNTEEKKLDKTNGGTADSDDGDDGHQTTEPPHERKEEEDRDFKAEDATSHEADEMGHKHKELEENEGHVKSEEDKMDETEGETSELGQNHENGNENENEADEKHEKSQEAEDGTTEKHKTADAVEDDLNEEHEKAEKSEKKTAEKRKKSKDLKEKNNENDEKSVDMEEEFNPKSENSEESKDEATEKHEKTEETEGETTEEHEESLETEGETTEEHEKSLETEGETTEKPGETGDDPDEKNGKSEVIGDESDKKDEKSEEAENETHDTNDKLDVNGIEQEEEKETPGTEEPTSQSSTTAPFQSIQISAGKSQTVTLPDNSVTLYGSIWPTPKDLSKFKVEWKLVGGADEGEIIHPHSLTANLAKLQVGTYTIRLLVRGPDNSMGKDFTNITVKPKPRVNSAPVAAISPNKGQVAIRLPTSSVVLDASKSHDEFDQKLSYLWEEVVWPINDHLDETKRTLPILHLSNLEAGNYRLKLTVTDSDGAKSVAFANITVSPELDFPPKAIAGDPQVIQLPINSVWLNGNQSTDDKGIVKYTWSKISGPDGQDKTGASTPYLHLSNLKVGQYQYQLIVEDASGQKDKSSVTVLVQSESKQPPHVEAGTGQTLQLPADFVDLVGKAWVSKPGDGCIGCKYAWSKKRFPTGDPSVMTGNDTLTLHLRHLIAGHYEFELVVIGPSTKEGRDTVNVEVHRYLNKGPKAIVGPSRHIHLPSGSVSLNGARSSDPDDGIATYKWERLPESPAAGDVVNGTDRQPVLQLVNLVEGVYSFRLTVKDRGGLSDSTNIKVTVHPVPQKIHDGLFEIAIAKNATTFSEKEKVIFLNHLATILGYSTSSMIHVYSVESRLSVVVLILYIMEEGKVRSAVSVVRLLKRLDVDVSVKHDDQNIKLAVARIDSYYCLNNCSDHGRCDPLTKLCICDTFWTENIFKARFGTQTRNCDWNVLYVILAVVAIVLSILISCWLIRCICTRGGNCCGHGRQKFAPRKRHRYALLRDRVGAEEEENIAMLPKGRSMLIESESEEEVLFDKSSSRRNRSRGANGFAIHS